MKNLATGLSMHGCEESGAALLHSVPGSLGLGVLGGVAGRHLVAVPGWRGCWMCRNHGMNSRYTSVSDRSLW